ncbi:hypothetical protein [Trichococcus collinsii]|uniref:hypothetical protein n=1 Tax=Trichococcus collinsii TaxID=157076 RepID=UPI0015A497D0|nr:hypothetical protein [Trichococcus collinsii]
MMVDQIIWIKSREINQQKSRNKVNEELVCHHRIGQMHFSWRFESGTQPKNGVFNA